MKPKPDSSQPPNDLRARAEARLAKTRQNIARTPDEDMQKVLHNLDVHQIELELQNDELRQSQVNLAAAVNRFSNLYDFAPCALLTVGPSLEVMGANLVACELLGLERETLLHEKFSRFIPAEARDTFHLFWQRVLHSGNRLAEEITIRSATGRRLTVLVKGIAIDDPATHKTECRLSLIDITEIKLTEEKLRQLSRAVEQSPVSIVITDPAGGIEYANARFVRLTGYTLAEILGRNPRFLQSGNTSQETYRELWKTITGGKEWRGELHNRKKDGELFWEDASISPIRDSAGRITHFLAVKEDITGRLLAEQSKQEALDRLRKIASRVPGVVYQFQLRPDGSSCFPFASEALKDIYRVNPEEVREDATKVLANIHPDDYARVVASIQASAQNLSPWQQEYRVKFDDGTIRALYGNAMPQREADGSVLWHGFITDITERNQTEAQLRQMTERQVLAARAGGVGIWDYDIVNNRLVWDEQMFRLYGITPNQFGGAYDAWQARFHPEDRQRCDEEIHLALCGQKDFDTEFRVLWPDGTTHSIRALAIVQRDPSGHPTHMLGTNWDITAQKQAEEKLRQTNQSLAEATVRANDMARGAEAANRAKSDFLAMMSHESRTPMNAVLGMTSLLLDTTLDPRQTEFARTVATSGQALLDIINEILDFSKIEAGDHFQLELEVFSLRELVYGVVQLLRPRADERGLALATELAADIPGCLKSDNGRLRQVLMNLVGNAIKFTDEGGVKVRVQCLQSEAHQVRLRFEVADTGIGISAEDAARLFEPFTQADSGASRRRGGTGLGLAISKRIVELMGGRMGVESVPGQGSLFWFELDLEVPQLLSDSDSAGSRRRESALTIESESESKSDPEPKPEPESERRLPSAATCEGLAQGRPLRILVAEDHEINRRLAMFMLESLGYSADFAANGLEAVDAWERTDHDLIIMDCQMPEMDGFAATREIRRREAARSASGAKRVRIVALTANAVKGDRELCLVAGMDGYLSKPYTAQQLREALEQCLAQPGKTPTTPAGPTLPVAAGFDPQRPAELCAELGDEGVLAIIEDFLQDLRPRAAEMETLASAGQLVELARLAHSLQGIGRSLGLEGFSAELRVLEQAAIAGDPAAVAPFMRSLPGGVEKSIAAIREWLAARAP